LSTPMKASVTMTTRSAPQPEGSCLIELVRHVCIMLQQFPGYG
jgi:hypothetical protein